ncbi:hypothetical protein PR048_018460 [Dryococelus australis]|uniref:DDE-1 domain-containing protein n=1 Tax=Dryococelus australis TaxID=614101 RepID=A0ABQ9HCC1_9NEOP|nr:hypothetical protein PR048_018460 [Dryococelus australis]
MGWMTTDIFQYFFIKFCEQVTERPLLLILDGHITHFVVSTVNIARTENVYILNLPAHTTDVLQPLDVSCFKASKYTRDLELVTKWYRENQRKMTKSEFVSVLFRVWDTGMKPENVRVGFMSTGLYPMNRDKYPVDRFDPEKYQRHNDCVQRDHHNSENKPAFQEQVHQDNTNLETQPGMSTPSVVENSSSQFHQYSFSHLRSFY